MKTTTLSTFTKTFICLLVALALTLCLVPYTSFAAKNDTANNNDGSETVVSTSSFALKVSVYQNKSWKKATVKSNGAKVNVGSKDQMRALKISVKGKKNITGSIKYRVHPVGKSWSGWKTNGENAGTASKKGTKVDAFQIKLTGELGKQYDVYYCAYSKTFGWQDWAKNGKSAGTNKLSSYVQKIQICIVAKGEAAPGSTANPYLTEGRLWNSILAQYQSSDTTKQLIFVNYKSGAKATINFYVKENGTWRKQFTCNGYVGKNGIGKTKEGDGKTPTGTYDITGAFGIKSNPGTELSYTQVNKYHYLCNDKTWYNTLIDIRQQNHTCKGEHMIDYKGFYDYGLFTSYNTNPAKYRKGSAIFVHCTKKGHNTTAGCIAMPTSMVKQVMQKCTEGAKICIY